MKIIFDESIEFDVDEVWEKFQNGDFFLTATAKVNDNYDFNTKISQFKASYPNGIVNKVEIYDNERLMNTLNNHYQVEAFTKHYSPEHSDLLIEIRKRPDLDLLEEEDII